MSPIRARVDSFCRRFGLEVPILLAPMAGASAPALSIAVMNAGGLGACGALLMQPDEIAAWADEVRAKGNGPYQLNLWVPDPPPSRGAGGGGHWCRRDRRAGDGGGRPSGMLRRLAGRTPARRIDRVDTGGSGRGRGAGGRDRRDRRRTWSCRGADARRERRADRICLS